MRDPISDDCGAFARFEAILFADEALQQALAEPVREDAFVAAAVEAAAARGVALQPEALARRLRPDPVGLAALLGSAPLRDAPPPGDWLPIGAVPTIGGALRIEWAHFAGSPLAESFYHVSAQRARARPFNAAFGCTTPLVRDDARAPDGIVFHQSRCGSTALSRMLGALPNAVSLSEAAPVDAVLRLGDGADRVSALRSILAPFGRRAEQGGGPFFVKADGWHSLFLPVFRAAFPDTPWLFLFRDPVEILVSQSRSRGAVTVPALVDPALFGLDGAGSAPAVEYCARVLARIAEAALDHRSLGGGLFVDYADFPEAIAAKILPHFGVTPDAGGRDAMAKAAAIDAKSPLQLFTPDAEAKRRGAAEAVRVAAETWMRPVYRRLAEAARP
ncbi:MAG: hypothetical protein ACJ8DZ_04640 [Allosphingosinicella sp.]